MVFGDEVGVLKFQLDHVAALCGSIYTKWSIPSFGNSSGLNLELVPEYVSGQINGLETALSVSFLFLPFFRIVTFRRVSLLI